MPTRQETAELIIQHLRSQRRKSEDAQGTSRLYGPDGTRCPVGVLIPQDKYSEHLEGMTVREYGPDGKKRPTTLGRLIVELGHDLDLVEAFQDLHDLGSFRTLSQSTYRLMCKFKLKFPETPLNKGKSSG